MTKRQKLGKRKRRVKSSESEKRKRMSKRQKLIVRKAKAKSECGKNNSFALWCGRESNAMVDANGKERFSEEGSRVYQFQIWDASAKSLVLVLRIKIGIIHVAICALRDLSHEMRTISNIFSCSFFLWRARWLKVVSTQL